MKRFRIEVNKTGVSVYDRANKIYLIDASTIETDQRFTICKRMVKGRKRFKWELKYEFDVRDSQKDL